MKTSNLKESVIEDYKNIISFVINDMKLNYRRDELFDIGMIGFVNGINTFDESKGFKYITYLYDCIKNEIIHFLQYEKRKRRDAVIVSLNTLINDIELGELIPTYYDYDKELYMEEMKCIIDRRLGKLKERDEKIFKHYYGIDGYEKLTSLQLEKKFNMSRQNVIRIRNRVLNMLRYEVRDYYKTYQDIMRSENKVL